MSLLTHCGVIIGTVFGIGGVLLFSPYHTYFSISYLHLAKTLLTSASMDKAPSSDEETEDIRASSSSNVATTSENFLFSRPGTRHYVKPKDDKTVDYKSFCEMKSTVANLVAKMDHLKADLVTAQNKIAMLERSVSQTPRSNITGLLFTPKRH